MSREIRCQICQQHATTLKDDPGHMVWAVHFWFTNADIFICVNCMDNIREFLNRKTM